MTKDLDPAITTYIIVSSLKNCTVKLAYATEKVLTIAYCDLPNKTKTHKLTTHKHRWTKCHMECMSENRTNIATQNHTKTKQYLCLSQGDHFSGSMEFHDIS